MQKLADQIEEKQEESHEAAVGELKSELDGLSNNDAQKATEGASIASAHGVRCVSDLKSSVVKTGSELNATAREKIQATPSDSSAA